MIDGCNDGQFYIGLYYIIHKIDEGAQSNVYLGCKDGKLYGIKIYKRHSQENAFQRELTFMQKITHQNWVKPITFLEKIECRLPLFPCSKASCLVMEYYKKGDLKKLLKYSPFSLPICRRILVSLLMGLEHAQNKGIIHRDIKPENILISQGFQFQIMDLGLAIHETEDPQQIVVGTKPFIAPEVFKQKKYSFASDLFAIGVIYFMMATGSLPFRQAKITDPRYYLLMQGNGSKFWQKLKSKDEEPFLSSFKNLIESMLAYNVSKRPTIAGILRSLELQQQICSQEQLELFFHKIGNKQNDEKA